jgi:glutamyl-Q tRNA(Asp) synthetase
MNTIPYRGRFAPSPTGPLHFGSLVAAVGSFLDARSRDGEWLLRMEDLDPPREMPGATDAILQTLDDYGLHWDGPVIYQSSRDSLYDTALARLDDAGQLYPCGCTRSDIARALPPDKPAGYYAGLCRDGLPAGREPRSIRVRVADIGIRFMDRLQGEQQEWLPNTSGDFVLRRADGLFAYQLAVVVDDAEQGITDIVRGADLLDSTGKQIYLQQLLGLPTPAYLHLPVAVNAQGEKLSKQTRALPVSSKHCSETLCAVLKFLGQSLEPGLESAALSDIWQWAREHWDTGALPGQRNIEHR